MVHIPYLQAFVDVNKRVSRLAANIPLIKHDVCPISFVDVPKQAYVDAIRGVYELNKIDLLKDVFVWAYEKSTQRYCEAQQHVGEPNIFLERYDTELRTLINDIISNQHTKKRATTYIDAWAKQHIKQEDQARFIEAVETQLLVVHEGNIATYNITPQVFFSWKKIWNG